MQMRKRLFVLACFVASLLLINGIALAQTYSFSLDKETVNAYWNQDGSLSIDYVFVFTNDPGVSPIDYVDVGINGDFVESSISADVNGQPVSDVSSSGYQGSDTGVAVGLGRLAILPGQTGQVHVFIGTVNGLLRPDSQDSSYASAVFAPTWFGSDFVHGTTNLSVTFHFPPGVQPDEPRWHESPSGWASAPDTGIDNQGRIFYTWNNSNASGSKKYTFGASFPKNYVPVSAVKQPGILELLGISSDTLIFCLFFCGFGLFFGFITIVSVRGARRRKLQYFPPKVSIEGHGIKRGLTAIEAGILLEESMDKILTMILFSVIKKGAASVASRDPLKLEINSTQPEDLQPYEKEFLQAFSEEKQSARRNELQEMMVNLVKSVSQKMKGFSRKETIAYYRDIVNRAWSEVEAADTPEVKSQKYDQVMEWTMLDKNYEGRTRDVFRTGPVFVPIWWPRYDPSFGRTTPSQPVSMPSGSGVSLPHLPGSDFAASMVHGVQDFSSSVIGNVTDFTSKITNKTNPVPVSTSSGGRSSGGGCACACACAGCACACAGGGR
jgi:hypothetical protein